MSRQRGRGRTKSRSKNDSKPPASADEYVQAFGLPDEDAEDAVLYVKVPAAIMAQLKTRAAERGKSVTKIVNDILAQNLQH